MPRELPLIPSVPIYRVQTTLGQTTYVFDLRWNGREGCWYLDLLAADGTPLALGRKIVIGWIPMRGTNPITRPRNFGALIAQDLSGKQREATLNDLGTRVRIYWFAPSELSEDFA
jgi:hypothetical protein